MLKIAWFKDNMGQISIFAFENEKQSKIYWATDKERKNIDTYLRIGDPIDYSDPDLSRKLQDVVKYEFSKDILVSEINIQPETSTELKLNDASNENLKLPFEELKGVYKFPNSIMISFYQYSIQDSNKQNDYFKYLLANDPLTYFIDVELMLWETSLISQERLRIKGNVVQEQEKTVKSTGLSIFDY